MKTDFWFGFLTIFVAVGLSDVDLLFFFFFKWFVGIGLGLYYQMLEKKNTV